MNTTLLIVFAIYLIAIIINSTVLANKFTRFLIKYESGKQELNKIIFWSILAAPIYTIVLLLQYGSEYRSLENYFHKYGIQSLFLVGAGASGKTMLANALGRYGLTSAISYTTRPKRFTEVQGIDYHFVSVDDFNHLAEHNAFIEKQTFNGWHYGSTLEAGDPYKVRIITPPGLDDLAKSDIQRHRSLYDKSIIMVLKIDWDVTKARMEKRNDADSVERRQRADREMFKGFFKLHKPQIVLTNPEFTVEDALTKIIDYTKKF